MNRRYVWFFGVFLFSLILIPVITQANNRYTLDQRNLDETAAGNVKWADLDQDGDREAVVIGAGGSDTTANGTISIFEQNSKNEFMLDQQFTPGGIEPSNIRSKGPLDGMELVDVTGDGYKDIVYIGSATNQATPVFFYLENNGLGGFSGASPQTIHSSGAVNGASIRALDVNGDNAQDLIVTGNDPSGGDTLAVYVNDGVGNFSIQDYPDSSESGNGYEQATILPWDLNDDGTVDLVIGGQRGGSDYSIQGYINDGSGNFTPYFADGIHSPMGLTSWEGLELRKTDVDNDGSMELFSSYAEVNGDTNPIFYDYDTTNDTFITAGRLDLQSHYKADGRYLGDFHFLDLTDNGQQDLLFSLGNKSNRRNGLVENNGSYSFSPVQENFVANEADTRFSGRFASPHDFDSDGQVELFFSGHGDTNPENTFESLNTAVNAVVDVADFSSISVTAPASNDQYVDTIPVEGSTGTDISVPLRVDVGSDYTFYTYGQPDGGFGIIDPPFGTHDLSYILPTTIPDNTIGSASSVQVQEPPLDQPYVQYGLDESSGPAYDSGTLGIHADLNGSITTGQTGIVNNAYQFTASSNDYLTGPNMQKIQSEPSRSATISFWFKPPSSPKTNNALMGNISNTDQNEFGLVHNEDLSVGCSTHELAFTSPGEGVSCSTETVTPDEWNHVVLTYDGSTVQFYINGNPGANFGDNGGFYGTGRSLYIGQVSSLSEYLDGQLDRITMYPYELSAQQIKAIRLSASGGSGLTNPSDGALVNSPVTVSGTVAKTHDVGDEVSVWAYGNRQASASVQSDSTWSTKVSGLSGVTEITARVHAGDRTTDIIPRLDKRVTVDVTGSFIQVNSPDTGTTVNAFSTTVSGTTDGASTGDSVVLSVNGVARDTVATSGGNWSATASGLIDGKTNLVARLHNGSTTTLVLNRDTHTVNVVTPKIQMNSPDTGTTINASSTTLSGTTAGADDGDSVVLAVNGTPNNIVTTSGGNWSGSISGLTNSDTQLTARLYNGSTSTSLLVSDTHEVQVTLPELQIGLPTAGSSIEASSATVSGTTTYADPGDSLTLGVGGTIHDTVATDGTKYSGTLSGLSTNDYTLTVNLHRSGPTSPIEKTTTRDFSIDRISPGQNISGSITVGDSFVQSQSVLTIDVTLKNDLGTTVDVDTGPHTFDLHNQAGERINSQVSLSNWKGPKSIADGNTKSMTFSYQIPDTVSALGPNQVSLADSIATANGKNLSLVADQDQTSYGYRSVDVSSFTTIQSPGEDVEFDLETSDFPDNTSITFTPSPSSKCRREADTVARYNPQLDQVDFLQHTARRLSPTNQPQQNVTVRFSYNGSLSDGVLQSLRVMRLDESNCEWTREDVRHVQVLPSTNQVEFTVPRFSTFRMFEDQSTAPTDLSNFKVAPNPYKPNDNHQHTGSNELYFAHVPEGTTIQVYTFLGGELVMEKTVMSPGNVAWNTRNQFGEKVGSGYFLYKVKHDGTTKTGKFAIVR